MSIVFMDDGKLSGSYCPTTVNLTCTVVNVDFLRWTYNASDSIVVDFQPDIQCINDPIIINLPTVFPFVQLTHFNTYKNEVNQFKLNATTILTVDILELYKNNIKTISCGSYSIIKTVPVNISILQPSFPSVSPQEYTSVIVHYKFGLVFSVDVSWRKFQVSIYI